MLIHRRDFVKILAGAGSVVALGKLGGFIPSASANQILRSHPVTKYSESELKKLRISFHSVPADILMFFQKPMRALFEGMQKQGYNVSWDKENAVVDSDIAVVTGWFQDKIIGHYQKNKKNILVLEQGNFQPRKDWISLGFNGLGGYGIYASAADDGKRFHSNFGHLLKPWREKDEGYVLLIGQFATDKSLHGLKMNEWLQDMTDNLVSQGEHVIFRPHPWEVNKKISHRDVVVPYGASLSSGSLVENMQGAKYVVTYSSTTALESVLAGIPAVSMSQGSVSWPVTSHDLHNPITKPDRMQWCNDLAWRQWTIEELANGIAWKKMNQVILK